MSNYTEQAEQFAKKHNITLEIGRPTQRMYFFNDTQKRYVFPCILRRKGESYCFKFGQSISEGSNKPDIYSILSCLTKYHPGTFDEFCAEFGYYPINNSREFKNVQLTYKNVLNEFNNVENLFSDIIEELAEIQ